MNLRPIVTMLEDAGLGAAGRTIFVNMMPAECEDGILVRQYFGGTKIDHELPGYRKTTFMLICRSKDYERAETLIEQAVTALTIKEETERDGIVWKFMRPDTEPFVYPLSVGGLLEFQVNIDAAYVLV
jgi:hypothetical protein